MTRQLRIGQTFFSKTARASAAPEMQTCRDYCMPPDVLCRHMMVLQVLIRAMSGSADSLQGWQLLSELQLQNEQFDLAADSAAKGLKLLAQRRSKGYQGQPHCAAGIVLARGYSLLALERLTEAQAMFQALAGLLVWNAAVPISSITNIPSARELLSGLQQPAVPVRYGKDLAPCKVTRCIDIQAVTRRWSI